MIALDVETEKFDKSQRKFPYNVSPLNIPYYLENGECGIVLDLVPSELKKMQVIVNDADSVVFHHAKFDIPKLEALGLHVPYAKVVDTLLGFGLINGPRSNGLKHLTETHLQRETIKFHEGIYTSADEMKAYAEADARNTFELVEPMMNLLEQERLTSIYREVELPLLPAMIALEKTGILINVEELKIYARELVLRNKELENEFKVLISPTFKPTSRKQIRLYIHEILKIKPVSFTEKGHPSTDSETLHKYYEMFGNREIQLLAEFLENSMILNSYIIPIFQRYDLNDHRLRCSYNQIGTDTGRSSAKDPNLQGISSDGPLRSFFIASPGYKIIRADFSQQEPRILAALSKEESLIVKGDLYKVIASEVFNVPVEQVTTDLRSKAKTLTIACIYGQQAVSIANSLGVSYPKAKNILRTFELKFKRIYEWKNDLVYKLHRDHFLTTPLGRRRRFDFSKGQGNSELNKIERAALNFVIQGTAADVSKITLKKVYCGLKPTWMLLAFIHDEYLLEVPESDEIEAKEYLARIMSEYIDWLGISLVAEVTSGVSWKEAKDSEDKLVR